MTSHVKQSVKHQESGGDLQMMGTVSGRPCGGCGTGQSLPGQRYCRKCKNEAQRKHYHKLKNESAKLRAMANRYGGGQ